MRGDTAVHRSLIVQHISSLNTLFQEKLWGGSEMVWKVVVASVLKDWISVSTFIGQNVISFAPVENSSILILLIGIFPFFFSEGIIFGLRCKYFLWLVSGLGFYMLAF